MSNEKPIVINGKELSMGQRMALLTALNYFLIDLRKDNDLGFTEDMRLNYLERTQEIMQLF